MSTIVDDIQKDISENHIMLYMKGTPEFPQCGFSNHVVQLLKFYGVPFKAKDVLADPELREAIKAFSHWPTIPQLYVKGEFIGGCDIVNELHQKNELKAVLS